MTDQTVYEQLLDVINFNQLQCPNCHHHGQFIRHGRYNRSFHLYDETLTIRILRVFCTSCKTTHALLPYEFVPYSQILFEDHIEMLETSNEEEEEQYLIFNEHYYSSTIRYLKRKFNRTWKQKLLSFSIPLDIYLTVPCFRHFGMHFMQTWRNKVYNILFSLS